MNLPLLQFCLEGNLSRFVAGVDEVGRGPLAGDVVAAVVILGHDHGIAGLADSKQLTAERREELYEEIRLRAAAFAVARASVREIDRINILQASLLAMKRAVKMLQHKPEFIYVDGNRCPRWSYKSEAVIQGDSKIASIAAASIMAKVTRDREMCELDKTYPGYGLARHKGYSTPEHLQALQKLGPCAIHRRTFRPVAELLGNAVARLSKAS
jgi:ribonuclease HII